MKRLSLVLHSDIQRHPDNNSTAKASYKFPKTERFRTRNPECPIAYYSNRSALSNRKASIGIGKKSDYTKDLAKTPGSWHYKPNTYYEFAKEKGKTFGVARDKRKDTSYLIPQIHKHPGVGKYQTRLKSSSSSYSMRSRKSSIDKDLTYRRNPGPGTYESGELTASKGRIMSSKHRSHQYGVTMTSPRFSTIRNTPGPQSYKQIDTMSPNSKYVVSTHCGKGTRPFSQQKRFNYSHWNGTKNPGPGAYKKPSDFGVYGDSKCFKQDGKTGTKNGVK